MAEQSHLTLLFLYAPGSVLVAEGVDYLSRAFAEDRGHRGPSLAAAVFKPLSGWLMQLKLQPTMDLFASLFNFKFPRYASWLLCSGATSFDAYAMDSWAFFSCSACSRRAGSPVYHKEFMYCFPPLDPGLQRRFVAKALRDGMTGVVIVEKSSKGIIWRSLRRFCVSFNGSKAIHKLPRYPGFLESNGSFNPPTLVAMECLAPSANHLPRA